MSDYTRASRDFEPSPGAQFPMQALPTSQSYPLSFEVGITKRELIAAMALSGWMASMPRDIHPDNVACAKHAALAVKLADSLLAELAKPGEVGK